MKPMLPQADTSSISNSQLSWPWGTGQSIRSCCPKSAPWSRILRPLYNGVLHRREPSQDADNQKYGRQGSQQQREPDGRIFGERHGQKRTPQLSARRHITRARWFRPFSGISRSNSSGMRTGAENVSLAPVSDVSQRVQSKVELGYRIRSCPGAGCAPAVTSADPRPAVTADSSLSGRVLDRAP